MLQYINQKWSLCMPGYTPIWIDFCQKPIRKGGQDLLFRAIKPTQNLIIIDATAGFGKDALLLASRGAQVLMLERQKILVRLLSDAKERLENSFLTTLNQKLTFLEADAIQYLHTLADLDYPDVVYLDPMHPQRQKSALVKKNMQILQQLWGEDSDAIELLNIAQQRVKQKVVMKWPVGKEPLQKPGYVITGKTINFLVYYPKN